MSARRLRSAAVLVTAVMTLAGCHLPTLSNLPVPNDVDGPTYKVTADFTDVQNLPQGAKVKLAGAVIGQVTRISTHDYSANISMSIRRGDPLPVGTTAQIRFTTPLGEMYVALTKPDHPGTARLHNGSHLDEQQTSAAPTIEDAFAALSTLINGGGLTQVGSIINELNNALKGNTGPTRDLIGRLTTLLTDLDTHKSDFNEALDDLDSLTRTLNNGRGVIDAALVTFPQTIRVLAAQTGRIRTVVSHVTTLSTVADDLLRRSSTALVADVADVRTVLTSLAGVRNTFEPIFAGLVRFGSVLNRSTPGDYIGADATVTLDFDSPATLPDNYTSYPRTGASSRSAAGASSRGSAAGSSSGSSGGASGSSSSRPATRTSPAGGGRPAVVVPRALTPEGVLKAVLGIGAR